MTRRYKNKRYSPPNNHSEVFTFEDMQGEHSLFDFVGCLDNGRYYETPVSWFDIEKILRSGVHHASAIQAKINILKE